MPRCNRGSMMGERSYYTNISLVSIMEMVTYLRWNRWSWSWRGDCLRGCKGRWSSREAERNPTHQSDDQGSSCTCWLGHWNKTTHTGQNGATLIIQHTSTWILLFIVTFQQRCKKLSSFRYVNRKTGHLFAYDLSKRHLILMLVPPLRNNVGQPPIVYESFQ